LQLQQRLSEQDCERERRSKREGRASDSVWSKRDRLRGSSDMAREETRDELRQGKDVWTRQQQRGLLACLGARSDLESFVPVRTVQKMPVRVGAEVAVSTTSFSILLSA
ncbi:hypothetical protein KCU83_g183, partial [Aureobasidium melanogenum]